MASSRALAVQRYPRCRLAACEASTIWTSPRTMLSASILISNVMMPHRRLEASRAAGPAAWIRKAACSHPAPHPCRIVLIGGTELAAHFGFLEGDVDPIGRREDGQRHDQHRPGPDPEGDAEGERDEAQIHR